MIFQFTHQAVIEGRKTATRRIVKPGEKYAGALPHAIPYTYRCVGMNGHRKIYYVGQTLAVQPGRTSKGIARIRLLSLRQEDVRNISREDVAAEGFPNRYEFFLTWFNMHDRRAVHSFIEDTDFVHYTIDNFLAGRPAERYQAWVLCFELVKD